MNKELIEYAIMFLNRTHLKGSEVPQFIAVIQELQKQYLDTPKPTSHATDEITELDTGEDDKIDFDEDEQEPEPEPEDEPEIKEKDIKHLKKDIKEIMAEVDTL